MSLFRIFCLTGGLLAFLAGISAASAQTATLTTPATSYSAAGGTVTLTATLNYAAPVSAPTALGFTIFIPTGWAVASVGGPNPVGVGPNVGATGQLDFAYFSFPPNSAQFTVTLNYPAGLTGNQTISGSAQYRSPTMNLSVAAIVLTPALTAPSIAASPASQSVTVGSPVTFTVTATGAGPLTYQWRKNGATIVGATSATFSIGSVQLADAAGYDVVVTNGGGSVNSAPAVLSVTNTGVAPAISVQPSSQTVVAGSAVSFSVTASGTPTPTYQWRKNGVAIAGASSATYSIGSAQTADAANYDVVVTNNSGTITSSVAVLTVTLTAVLPSISIQPISRTVVAGSAVSFSVTASGTPEPTYQWRKNGVAIASATSATFSLSNALAADAANYDVIVSNSAGSVTSTVAVLSVTTPTTIAPAISVQPSSQTIAAGSTVSFGVVASGTPAPVYQWRKNGAAIAGATSATLSLTNVQSIDAAVYDVVVSNSAGSVTSSAAQLTVLASRLINASVRSPAGASDQTLAVGFVIGGTGSKRVLLRGIGPSLAQFGITNALADPQLRLFTGGGSLITLNDDWGGDATLAGVFSQVGAFPLAPASKDAAVWPTLPAGSYAAHVTSASGSGVALLETYDTDSDASTARFVNLSVLAGVGTGGNVLVIGFVIAGNTPKNLLIRGIGPALLQFGVGKVLADPQLRLFDDKSRQIQENNDWGGTTALANAIAQAGAFALPAASKDAALLVNLAPGLYSAQVSGVGDTTGVALIELYELP